MKKLRDYQLEAHKKLDEAFSDGDNAMLCLATGSGKTFCAATWIAKKRYSVLWVAHRIELIRQAEDTFREIWENHPWITISKWTAESKDATGNIVLAMVGSTKTIDRIDKHFDCVVIDECHHSASQSYITLLKKISFDRKLGLTATPARLDGKDLGFNRIAFQKSLLDLAKDGYLASPKYICVRTQKSYSLRTQAGDFSKKSMRLLDNDDRNKIILDEYIEHREEYGKTIIFCVDVKHCENLDAMFKKSGVNSRYSSGKTTKSERNENIEWFANSKDSVLINCMLYTEGFDAPDTKTIFLARPTQSKVLYMQMVGRGSRVLRGKDKFNIVDFVDQVDKYPYLAEKWSVQELGYDPDEDERAVTFRRNRVLRAFREYGVKKVSRDILNVVGLAVVNSKFDADRKIVITDKQYECIAKFRNYLIAHNRETGYKAVRQSYAILGSEHFKYKDWMSIAWSMYFKFLLHKKLDNGKQPFQYIEIAPTPEPNFDTEDIVAMLAVESDRHDKMNKSICGDFLDKFKNYLSSKGMDGLYRIMDMECTSIFYENAVVTIVINKPFATSAITRTTLNSVREHVKMYFEEKENVDVHHIKPRYSDTVTGQSHSGAVGLF